MLTIGKLAAVLGLHPDTIRSYERKGLIPAAKRSPMNGYRIWSQQDVAQVRQAIFGVNQATEEGSAVDQLRGILANYRPECD